MKFVLPAVVLLGLLFAGLLAGMQLQRLQVPRRTMDAARVTLDNFRATPGTKVGEWQEINTNLHLVEVAAIQLAELPVEGGSLVEVGDNIVISSPFGQLSYLDAGNELRPLDLRVPMNLDALHNDPLNDDPLFNIAEVRTYDLLSIETGIGTYDLYAAYNRFAGQCFEFVVSKVALDANGSSLSSAGEWHDVWTAKPCIPFKNRGWLFTGVAGGGRMVQKDEGTLLVAVGDYDFDGHFDSRVLSTDAATDLGKIIELDVRSGASRHFAFGVRNPQGMTIARDGRIWETEHGPQGGDEVNLLVDGENYGWPMVSYGLEYGPTQGKVAAHPNAGRHDGYARPRIAFVPSIGIGSMVEPDPNEFPGWAGSLVANTLRAHAIYVLKVEGDDIVYGEPIFFGDYRLRDIISLRDGRLAILADTGTLLFVRNREKHLDDARPIEITGLLSLPQPPLEEVMLPIPSALVDRGGRHFQSACVRCHSLTGEIGIGPPLNGVVGRRIAGISGFGYSSALAGYEGEWTESALRSYIRSPQEFVPGTTMTEVTPNEHVADLITYLRTTSETNGSER